ncbi:MAG TPA: hypothetical protein PKD28_01405 [Candidatus Saccharibacteria bacterium]|nr:hypothetical protein [Candidatus Saccharibacteria bacterium]
MRNARSTTLAQQGKQHNKHRHSRDRAPRPTEPVIRSTEHKRRRTGAHPGDGQHQDDEERQRPDQQPEGSQTVRRQTPQGD